jgi:hypothetical protein
MSAIQRKSAKKEQPATGIEVQESIEIPLPQPKKKSSSKQEPIQDAVDIVDDDSTPSVAVVETKPSKKEKGSSKPKDATLEVINDDSTPSVAVVETKPSKKGKKSAPKSDEEEAVEPAPEPAPKKGKGKKVESEDEGDVEVVEKSKKQPPKSLGEQISDSVETLANQSEKFKVLIELKEAFQKNISALISSRKKELKKLKENESEDENLQFLEKQKDSLKDEIAILKSSIRELTSVSKVIEKATKQLDSKKKKTDPSEPKKERAKKFVPVSTDSMTSFIKQNLDLKTNNGNPIFEQTPETNSDGHLLVETSQLMQLIHAYIREKSLRKDKLIELDSQLEPLFSAFFQRQEKKGIIDSKPDSASVMSVIYDHVEKKSKK